jgi:hypothetical protein
LNLEENTGGSGTTTIIQQTTDANLFYTKTATDALLNAKANSATLTNNYYDKTNIDSKITTINNSIATKANTSDLDSYYTKAQTDTLIADANPPLSIDFSNYYNKQTTDTLLDAKANSLRECLYKSSN